MDFWPFDWFNGDRLSAHILNPTNMVNELVRKRAEKFFSPRTGKKKWPAKNSLLSRINAGRIPNNTA